MRMGSGPVLAPTTLTMPRRFFREKRGVTVRERWSSMMVCLMLLVALLSWIAPLQAQERPVIVANDVRSEFISDNANPEFVVRGLKIAGPFDSIDVVIHPSAIRSQSTQQRYKPVLVAVTHDDGGAVFIAMKLTGKDLPLPDSVRGAVILSVRALLRLPAGPYVTSTQRLTVPIANEPLPKGVILTQAIRVEPITDQNDPEIVVRGIMLRTPKADSVDGMPDIRPMEYGVEAAVSSASVRDMKNNTMFGASVIDVRNTGGQEYQVRLKLTGGRFPLSKGQVRGSIQLDIKAVTRSRGQRSVRSKIVPIIVGN